MIKQRAGLAEDGISCRQRQTRDVFINAWAFAGLAVIHIYVLLRWVGTDDVKVAAGTQVFVADASGLLTTAMQLSQAVGVAVFGSLFLTVDDSAAARAAEVSVTSGHALFVTLAWIAVTLACGAAVAVPLARTVRAAASGSPAG